MEVFYWESSLVSWHKAEIKVTAIVSGENNDPHIDGRKAVKFVSNVIYLAGFSVQTSD